MPVSFRNIFLFPLLFMVVFSHVARKGGARPEKLYEEAELKKGLQEILQQGQLAKEGQPGKLIRGPRGEKIARGVQQEMPNEEQPGILEAGKIVEGGQQAQPGNPTINGAGPVGEAKPIATNFLGKFELFLPSTGVSCMHSILLPNNKLMCYDATIWAISDMKLPPGVPCRRTKNNFEDCWCHAVLIDSDTGNIRPLRVDTDTWCSSGALNVEGSLVGTGGDKGGTRTVRYLDLCDTCNLREHPDTLSAGRWYSTQVVLGDGSFVVFGGRDSFSFEFVPPEGQRNPNAVPSQFLHDTSEVAVENNLYPFVHVAPDGNLFMFANNRAILFDPRANRALREYPPLEGGGRCYPSSGVSTLIPFRLQAQNPPQIPAEVLVCGGAPPRAFTLSEPRNKPQQFLPALNDCNRMVFTDPNPVWEKEEMPMPRVMSDIVMLPTGDIIIINGAMKGTSAWDQARDHILTPILYKPNNPINQRFQVLAASTIPRMYHSVATLLPDGRIFVAGSNTNDGYLFKNVLYPTELRGEKFSPPYLDPSPEVSAYRTNIHVEASDAKIGYNQPFNVEFDVTSKEPPTIENVDVSMNSIPFTTHGIAMNQRLLFLGKVNLAPAANNAFKITVQAPPSGNIAPPGYYLLSIVFRGIPSARAMWVQIK